MTCVTPYGKTLLADSWGPGIPRQRGGQVFFGPPPTLTEDFIQKKAAAGEKILVPFFEKFDGFSKNFENLTVS